MKRFGSRFAILIDLCAMRTIILLALLSIANLATAQADERPIDLKLAGHYLEKAGTFKADALITGLILGGIGAYETQRNNRTDRIVGWSLLSASAVGFITIHINIAGKERKAGRILQGKPPK